MYLVYNYNLLDRRREFGSCQAAKIEGIDVDLALLPLQLKEKQQEREFKVSAIL